MQNSRLVVVDRGRAAAGGAGKGLEALQREGGNKAVMRVGERDVALHLRTDRLPVVVVEDQPVDVAGQEIDAAGQPHLGGNVLAAQDRDVHAALVGEHHLTRIGRAGQVDAAVQQGVPASRQMVQPTAFVSEVAVGRPAALAIVLRAHQQVHAAVDRPVGLLAKGVAPDGRSRADDRDQKPALAARLARRMAQIRQVKDGYSEKFEPRIGCGCLVVFEFDGPGDDLPVRLGQTAVGHRAVDDFVTALARLQHDPRAKEKRIRRGIDRRATKIADTLRAMHVEIARGVHI